MHTELSSLIPRRSIAVGLALALSLPLAAGLAWLGPWSPRTLAQADRLAQQQQVDRALQVYGRAADWAPTASQRADALFRAGQLAATAQRPQLAVVALRQATREFPDDARAADSLARLGEVLARDLARPERAAGAYQRAAEASSGAQAAEYCLRSAELRLQAEQPHRAWLAYETCAKTHPDSAHAAWLAMANIKLSVGDVVGAARLFERVTKTGAMGETLALAQLGATVTHERLGDYQAVLAELSHSDLSPELQGRRRDRVVERESR